MISQSNDKELKRGRRRWNIKKQKVIVDCITVADDEIKSIDVSVVTNCITYRSNLESYNLHLVPTMK